MLATTSTIAYGEKKPEVWVVDEASMLGARNAKALLAQARAQGARLVLVGGVDQLGSVEAGRAFGQLQNAGTATFRLEEIVRYRVEAVDADSGTVRLVPDKGKVHDWQPARWGAAQAEAFVEVEQEFRAGDRVEFTRNNYRAERHNGDTAEVVAIDPVGSSMILQREDGRRNMLDLAHLADRHVRLGWVRTIHSSQGATRDRVMAHLESFRANTVDAASAYVAISRARTSAAVYTDNRASLTEALGLRDGAQVEAISKTIEL